MARKKHKRIVFKRRTYFFIATVVITLGLVLLVVNRSKKKEPEYSIEFHEKSAEMYIGDTRRFGYTIINPKGNDALTWSTSNAAVASVDAWGNITGNSFGDVTISVRLDNGCESRLALRINSYPVYLKLKTNINPIKGWFNKKVEVTLETLNVYNIKYCVSLEETCFENIDYKDKITLSNGHWYLNIKGIDKNGKEVTYRDQFKVDLVAPKCNVTRIGKIAEGTGLAEVICESDASGIEKYEWYRDNEKIETTVDRQFLVSNIYLKGKHKYSVKVYDLVGNASTYEVD